MVAEAVDLVAWLRQADIQQHRLTPQQVAVLDAACRFRQRQGSDYYSTRLLSHFLLHCDTGLKVAAIARLLGLARPTASGQQGLSSKQAIQQALHRLRGRPYGKLLPRFAGPIVAFLLEHPKASRAELLDFINRTFGVRVSRIALYKFLKKYGLDHIPGQTTGASLPAEGPQTTLPASPLPPATAIAASADVPVTTESHPTASADLHPEANQQPADAPDAPELLPASAAVDLPGRILLPRQTIVLAPPPAPPFSSHGRNTPALFC